ncbi:MAG: hypothetical protein S4CHLAM7_03090 [Chlamydiae bacterium]|nr:hypothetical protein [Chlamydiota bacterium]
MTIYNLNPYSGQAFFSFFNILFLRIIQLIQGNLSLKMLAPDELQVLSLALIAISSSIVGVFLIHRKMTTLANALSHTVIFGIVLTYLILRKNFELIDPSANFKVLFIASLVTGTLTALLTQFISKVSKLQKEASIGLVFTTFFALGILMTTLFSKNSHVGIDMIMGNVDALHYKDLTSIFTMFISNLVLVFLFMRGLKISTFDPVFSKLSGFSPNLFNYIVILQLSMTAIGAFRAIGVVLVLAFFTVPPLLARLYATSLEKQIVIASLIGALSAGLGVSISRHCLTQYGIALSTGGITTLCLYFIFFLNHLLLKFYKMYKSRIFTLKIEQANSLNSD